eukprot:g338.t1
MASSRLLSTIRRSTANPELLDLSKYSNPKKDARRAKQMEKLLSRLASNNSENSSENSTSSKKGRKRPRSGSVCDKKSSSNSSSSMKQNSNLDIAGAVKQMERKGYKIFPYPSQDVSRKISELVGGKCKTKHVNSWVVNTRNKRRRKNGMKPAFFYFILNKPRGLSSMRNPADFKVKYETCYSVLPKHQFPHVGHVGRLDVDTEGLILFTDDGRLCDGLINDSISSHKKVEKTYVVEVNILPWQQRLNNLLKSDDASMNTAGAAKEESENNSLILLEKRMKESEEKSVKTGILHDSFLHSLRLPLLYSKNGAVTRPATVTEMSKEIQKSYPWLFENSQAQCHSRSEPEKKKKKEMKHGKESFWLQFCISQGKNRQIRRLCHRAGLYVSRLVRVKLGPLCIAGKLKTGEARMLTEKEVRDCYEIAVPGLKAPENLRI